MLKPLARASGFFLPLLLMGCPAPSECAKKAEAACHETAVTVRYFNGLAGDERYSVEDCLKLIPLQCPPGVP